MNKLLNTLCALLLIASVCLTNGCGDKAGDSPRTDAAIQISVMKTSLAQFVTAVNLRVIADETEVFDDNTTVINGEFSFGTITVPVGAVTFIASAYGTVGEVPNQLLYSATRTVEVVAGGNVIVELQLTPVPPMVRLSPYFVQTTAGEALTSKVEVWNIAKLRQAALGIVYDSALLEFVSATPANNQWGELALSVDGIPGALFIDVERSSNSDLVPAGIHEIINLSFTTRKAGDAAILLVATELNDDAGPIQETDVVVVDFQTVEITGNPINQGTLTGFVTEALDGLPLVGASVSVTGAASRQTTTDANGQYSFTNLPFGVYELSILSSGYVTSTRTVNHNAALTTENATLTLVLQQGQFRIILSWDETPADLDSHLWTTLGEILYEIYWSNQGSAETEPFIFLDDDDTDGRGPETITIMQLRSLCQFAVYNYSNEALLTQSNARVEVYDAGGLIVSYPVPTIGAGRWWYVFDLTANGTVVPKNEISDNQPGGIPLQPKAKAVKK